MEKAPETATETSSKKSASRIGKYTVVDLAELELRDIWKHEAQNFTKWMSQTENIRRLGEILDFDFDLQTIDTESKGGQSNRRCDIVVRLRPEEGDDETQGEIVAIENQLEKTDFSHLGRLILYAALKKATRIVWVVKKAAYDHRKAIAWLNENTTDSLRFYLVEVAVYDLNDNNRVAPVFRLVEQPDEEEKVQQSGTPKRKENLAFWRGFCGFLDETPKGETSVGNKERLACINSFPQPSGENWYRIAIGSSKCHINLEYSREQVKIVILTEDSEKAIYRKLEARRDELRKAVGCDFKCNENIKQPLLRFFGPKCNIGRTEKNGVKEAYEWLVDSLSKIVPIVQAALR